ncbi:hypothetical protein MUP77_10635 [Candidatus Bathyarchaeota archaeon]|nr:hypothetical protein [Candidatus Bathyarchaeota archaeon]
MVVAKTESICANCSACSLLPLNNGYYRCRRYGIIVTLNDTCETIDLLKEKARSRKTPSGDENRDALKRCGRKQSGQRR